MYSFFEFFAGGGMARMGLGEVWSCAFANDCSEKKAEVYRANFPDALETLRVDDVANIGIGELPGTPDLVWGSFPCQDLSLAGSGAGLNGLRSGVFWPFLKLVRGLQEEQRGPAIVVLENVEGILTSHDGSDFRTVIQALSDSGYRVGAVTVDAVHFVPQSRPRVFFVATSKSICPPSQLIKAAPLGAEKHPWHSEALQSVQRSLPDALKKDWLWWEMASPAPRAFSIQDVLEAEEEVSWAPPESTRKLLAMMSDLNLSKVQKARELGTAVVGTVYKRTRNGVQRAEVRFDGISGCLRTPGGGSSRQTILLVEEDRVRSRLLTPREAARLMGIPDSYTLPANYNDAYHIAGDGLAVPAVSWIEKELLRPLMNSTRSLPGTLLKRQEGGRLAYA